jgi:hypothetical protein
MELFRQCGIFFFFYSMFFLFDFVLNFSVYVVFFFFFIFFLDFWLNCFDNFVFFFHFNSMIFLLDFWWNCSDNVVFFFPFTLYIFLFMMSYISPYANVWLFSQNCFDENVLNVWFININIIQLLTFVEVNIRIYRS